MKLALVTETFPPEINGVAMTLGNVVEGLARRGHRVTVVRPRQSAADRPRVASLAADSAGAPAGAITELLVPGVPLPGYRLLRLGLPVRGRLRRAWHDPATRPDLVHVATEGPLGYAALSAARSLGLPVSSSFHTNFHAYMRHYGAALLARPALAYLRHFHNRTRVTLTPSPALNAELTAAGFHDVRLMSRGVDTTHFHPGRRSPALRAQWGVAAGDLAVIHVSRLAAEKNYPAVLAAFAAVCAGQPRAKLIIVSDGPLRSRLARTAPPGTVFTGFLSRDALADAYASADLFVYASLTETFGNVVLEAAASGLPLVTYDYAAAAHYLRHRDSAWLAPVDDERALLAGAHTLAADPALRARLAARGRAVAETVPWSAVIAQLEQDLLSVLVPASPGAVPLRPASC